MTISGIAGINPLISVYRHTACGIGDRAEHRFQKFRHVQSPEAVAACRAIRPFTMATSRPPNDENACV